MTAELRLVIPHVAQTFDVDYPPGSGEVVGRIDISKLSGEMGYTAVDGFLGNRNVYSKEIEGRSLFSTHLQRKDKAMRKAVKEIRYGAVLARSLPRSTDLA